MSESTLHLVHKKSWQMYYRSLNGDGMFNYRMMFPFEYSETKRRVIVSKKVCLKYTRITRNHAQPLQLAVAYGTSTLGQTRIRVGGVKLSTIINFHCLWLFELYPPNNFFPWEFLLRTHEINYRTTYSMQILLSFYQDTTTLTNPF